MLAVSDLSFISNLRSCLLLPSIHSGPHVPQIHMKLTKLSFRLECSQGGIKLRVSALILVQRVLPTANYARPMNLKI